MLGWYLLIYIQSVKVSHHCFENFGELCFTSISLWFRIGLISFTGQCRDRESIEIGDHFLTFWTKPWKLCTMGNIFRGYKKTEDTLKTWDLQKLQYKTFQTCSLLYTSRGNSSKMWKPLWALQSICSTVQTWYECWRISAHCTGS